MMRSGNPAFSDSMLENFHESTMTGAPANTMTIGGTATKTLILLGLCVGSAGFTWGMVWQALRGEGAVNAVMPWMMGGVIGGLVLALVTTFKPAWASVSAPLYALAQGLFLGGLSALLESRYPGIAMQAVAATFGTTFALMMVYQMGLVKATEGFKAGVMAATGGIAIVYLASIVMSFFGMSMPFIHEANWIGIGFSVFVVIIAALNLVLDFDFIERAAASGAPKSMEWYGAFGLMVTMVWLYIEILRLLAKLNSRD